MHETATLGLSNHQVKPYASDGGFSTVGLTTVAVIGVVVAVVSGVLASIVGHFFYVVLAFPVLIGMAVGGAQMWTIKQAKVRTALMCGATGLLAGIIAVTTIHYVDYLAFRGSLLENDSALQEARQALAGADDVAENALLTKWIAEYLGDDEFAAAEGVTSFTTYLDWSARQGVELSSSRSSSKPINIGYVGSYVYWGIEALIVALIAGFMARTRADEPFCSDCDQWKSSQEFGTLEMHEKEVARVLESGRLSDLADAQLSPGKETAVSVFTCPDCGADNGVVLQVDAVSYNQGNRVKSQQGRFVYPAAAAVGLVQFFAKPQQSPLSDDVDPEVAQQMMAAAQLAASSDRMPESIKDSQLQATAR